MREQHVWGQTARASVGNPERGEETWVREGRKMEQRDRAGIANDFRTRQ